MSPVTLRIGLFAAAFVALAIVVEFVYEIRQSVAEREQLRLESQAEAMTLSLERRIISIFDNLNSVAALFEGSENVTPDEFNRYIERTNVLTATGRPRAIAVMPFLDRADIPMFERQMDRYRPQWAASGYPQINVLRSDDRDQYAPVVMVESADGRDGILGYDLASNTERLVAAKKAMALGDALMTRPVRLSQDDPDSLASVLLLTSVDTDIDGVIDENSYPLAGRKLIIAAGFTPSLALRDLIERQDRRETLRFALDDTTDNDPVRIMKSFTGAATGDPSVIDNVVFGDRVWTFSYYPQEDEASSSGLHRITILGAIGVILVIALTVALDRLLRNRAMLESKVNTRTEALREANQALTRAVSQANAESEAKSNFLARMSHDLRTPLNAVIGYAQFISSELYGRVEERRYIEHAKTIEEAGRIQLQLVEEILALTALQSGARTFENEPFRLNETVRQSVEIVQLKASEKGIDIAVFSALTDKTVRGDAASIQQILLNLLTNSIKFTEPGGRITVRTDPRPDGGFTLRIADTGIGISVDDIENILRPFSKSKSNPYTADEGVGLGLTIVKTLAEANGGGVTIDSELNVGTTVSVSFPNRDAEPSDD